jgi:hypothetical protein
VVVKRRAQSTVSCVCARWFRLAACSHIEERKEKARRVARLVRRRQSLCLAETVSR